MNENWDEYVTIATFVSPMEAEATRLGLEAEGIPAILQDANLVQMDPLLGIAVGDVKLQVPRSRVGVASDRLEQVRQMRQERREMEAENEPAGEDRCLACAAGISEDEDVCPKCGWSWYQGT